MLDKMICEFFPELKIELDRIYRYQNISYFIASSGPFPGLLLGFYGSLYEAIILAVFPDYAGLSSVIRVAESPPLTGESARTHLMDQGISFGRYTRITDRCFIDRLEPTDYWLDGDWREWDANGYRNRFYSCAIENR